MRPKEGSSGRGLCSVSGTSLAILAGLAVCFGALGLLASVAEGQGDLNLSGHIEDQRLDVWQDIYVPAMCTLELSNVTIVFHDVSGEAHHISGGDGSVIIIRDGDGDPSTTQDASLVTSADGPWSLLLMHAQKLEVTNSMLTNFGGASVGDGDLEVAIINTSIEAFNGRFYGGGLGRFVFNGTSFNGSDYGMDLVGYEISVDDCHFTATGDVLLQAGASHWFIVRNSTFACDRTMNLHPLERALIEDCSFKNVLVRLDPAGARITRCSFSGGRAGVQVRAFDDIIVGDSVFDSGSGFSGSNGDSDLYLINDTLKDVPTAIEFGGGVLSVSGCTFIRCPCCIRLTSSPRLFVSGSTFQGNDTGISTRTVRANQSLRMENSTMNGFRTAIHVSMDDGSTKYGLRVDRWCDVTIIDTGISNCTRGLVLDAINGTASLTGVAFENVIETAVDMPYSGIAFRETILDDCSFLDVGMAINHSINGSINDTIRKLEPAVNLTVERCSFIAAGVSIVGQAWNVIVRNCTFQGGLGSGARGDGLRVRMRAPFVNRLIVHDCSFDGCGRCIGLDAPMADRDSQVSVLNGTFRDCGVGLSGDMNCTIDCDRMAFSGCDVCVDAESAWMARLNNLTMTDCREGLQFYRCGSVRLVDVSGSNTTGWFIDEQVVDFAIWKVYWPSTISDARIRLCGALDIWADITLRDTMLVMAGDYNYNTEIIARAGARVTLERVQLSATTYGTYALNLWQGAVLDARDSVISGCRRAMTRPDNTGPYAEGAEVDLFNVTLDDCYRGFNVLNGSLVAGDCRISSEDYGIFANGSEVTLSAVRISSGTVGVAVRDCRFHAVGCQIEGTLRSSDIQGSNVDLMDSSLTGGLDGMFVGTSRAVLTRVDLHADARVLRLELSTVELWACSLPPGTGAEVLRESNCTLFNTSWDGHWLIETADCWVEVLWSHEIVAVCRWSGAPLPNAMVLIEPSAVWWPSQNVTLGPDGRAEPVWLLERRLTEDNLTRPSPYNLSLSAPGLFGEATSACVSPSNVTIVVRDVSPPEVVVGGPKEGTIQAEAIVAFWGSVKELGSGLGSLMYCVDDGNWVPLTPNVGSWSVGLGIVDGRHALSVRATDLDGNQGLNYTTVVIDTLPPFVIFTSPKDLSLVNTTTVVLEGHVDATGGTAIASVTLNGEVVTLDLAGHFSRVVKLIIEGENVFELRAIDLAGNEGTAYIDIVRDTIPPELDLGNLPNITNKPTLSLWVSSKQERLHDVQVDGVPMNASGGGNFTTDVHLAEGPNLISVRGTDLAGNVATTVVRVVLDTIVNATIVSPRDGDVIRGDIVALVLQTDPFVKVHVWGQVEWLDTGETGRLQINLSFRPWNNVSIAVSFRDPAGNEVYRQVTVTVAGEAPERPVAPWPGWALLVVVVLLALLGGAAWSRRRMSGRMDG